MIRLTDKMGIFPAVNIINKQRNSPISPRTYSFPLLRTEQNQTSQKKQRRARPLV